MDGITKLSDIINKIDEDLDSPLKYSCEYGCHEISYRGTTIIEMGDEEVTEGDFTEANIRENVIDTLKDLLSDSKDDIERMDKNKDLYLVMVDRLFTIISRFSHLPLRERVEKARESLDCIVEADVEEYMKLAETYPNFSEPNQLDTYETEDYQRVKYNLEDRMESILDGILKGLPNASK